MADAETKETGRQTLELVGAMRGLVRQMAVIKFTSHQPRNTETMLAQMRDIDGVEEVAIRTEEDCTILRVELSNNSAPPEADEPTLVQRVAAHAADVMGLVGSEITDGRFESIWPRQAA